MGGLPHLATILSAIVFFGIGAVWYNALQRPWLEGVGKTFEQLMAEQGSSPLPYAIGFVAILIMCYTLAHLIVRTGSSTLAGGMRIGALVALGLVGAMLALNYGFESRPAALWLVNAGYALVGLTLAGGIIGGWKRRDRHRA